MSYILDALKKAERERGMAQVPTLATVHDTGEKPSRLFLIFSTAALTLLAAGLGLFLFWGNRDDRPAVEFRDSNHRQIEAGLPASMNSSASAGEPGVSSSILNQAEHRRPISPSEPTAGQTETGGVNAGIPSASVPRNTPGAPHIAGEKTPPAATLRQRPPQPILPESGSAPHEENALQNPDQSLGETGFEENQTRSPEPADRKTTFERALEELHISILLYADSPSDRLVFINGRKYGEGDYVDGRFLLERITQDGAVLSYEGERAVLKQKKE